MTISENDLQTAISKSESGIAISILAKEYNVPYSTLYKLIRNKKTPTRDKIAISTANDIDCDSDIVDAYHKTARMSSEKPSVIDTAIKIHRVIDKSIKDSLDPMKLKYYSDCLKNVYDIYTKVGTDVDDAMENILMMATVDMPENDINARGEDLDANDIDCTDICDEDDMGEL
jgi:hypothetical protein